MTPRFARPCLALFLLVLVFEARAQPPAPNVPPGTPPGAAPTTAATAAAPRGDDPLVTLKLPDADIDTIITALEIYTGRSALRPSTLAIPNANFNLKLTDPLPKSQAILAIETVLALNGVGVTRQGERFLIINNLPQIARSAPELITGSAFDQPANGKIAVKVYQLEFLRAQEVAQIVQSIVNMNLGSPPLVLVNANALMVTDSVSNLQRVEALLQQLDKPVAAGIRTKFYGPLRYAAAAGVVAKLRSILQGPLSTQLGSVTTYQADERTNQIVLVTDPRQFPFFDDLIERLDVDAAPNTRTDVIYLRHATATKLVPVLSLVINGQNQAAQKQNSQSIRPGQLPTMNQPNVAPPIPGAAVVVGAAPAAAVPAGVEGAGSGASEFSALMTVAPDERSNAVVVSGTADDIRLIKDLIEKLDIVLAQVRIEVVIAEVTLDDANQSGISQLGLKVEGNKLVAFSGADSTTTVTNGTISRHPWDLAAEIAITTTPRKNNTTILTVPVIVTSHGKQAIINDGETRPIISGSTTIPGAAAGATTSSQINQQPIGTTLTITPFIGNDGSVQLDIVQELSDVTGTVTVDGNTQYIIGTRKLTSSIYAKSGQIYVLGGFRKKIDSKQTNRLGPIPFLGDLLGKRVRDKYHQELIFFLRPYVLTNDETADNASTMQQLDKLPTRDEIKLQLDPNYQPPVPKTLKDKILSK